MLTDVGSLLAVNAIMDKGIKRVYIKRFSTPLWLPKLYVSRKSFKDRRYVMLIEMDSGFLILYPIPRRNEYPITRDLAIAAKNHGFEVYTSKRKGDPFWYILSRTALRKRDLLHAKARCEEQKEDDIFLW